MAEASQAALRVALLAGESERGAFRAMLEREGFEVVVDEPLKGPFPDQWHDADVLLVEMGDRCDRSRIQSLLQESPLPVLLNQGGVGHSEIWQRRLFSKLQTLADRALPSAELGSQRTRPDLRVVPDAGEDGDFQVVILGASIGGPKAIARFLQALPEVVPVVFLLAQHISEAFQDLLVEQLDRCSSWPVAVLGDTQTVSVGQVWLIPAERQIEMDTDGLIRRSERGWESGHRPNINAVLQSAAKVYGDRCGVILFSGLGKDGSRGCEMVSRHGGFVWAQSSESCVIANLPEAARQTECVELSGTPEALAAALSARYQTESASLN